LVGRKDATNAEWLLLFKCLDCGLEVSFCFPRKILCPLKNESDEVGLGVFLMWYAEKKGEDNGSGRLAVTMTAFKNHVIV
jgi:hypothetical protein